DFRLIAANIDNVIMAHIHCGPPGVNGPIRMWLYPVIGPSGMQGPNGSGPHDGVLASDTFSPADVTCPKVVVNQDEDMPLLDAIRAGLTYVNVHTRRTHSDDPVSSHHYGLVRPGRRAGPVDHADVGDGRDLRGDRTAGQAGEQETDAESDHEALTGVVTWAVALQRPDGPTGALIAPPVSGGASISTRSREQRRRCISAVRWPGPSPRPPVSVPSACRRPPRRHCSVAWPASSAPYAAAPPWPARRP
ncbi:MAG: CHRD domain-containing protein, partial [Gemmatimonadetes bacterium]|nr:CHRD domain-containing protein [Gemmatimonadota bacterium]